jgi:hypothetical protein
MPIRSIETAGGWGLKSEAQKTYVTGALVSSVLLPLAGWDNNKNSYFCSWESNVTTIYPELVATVFPELDNIGRKVMTVKKFATTYPTFVSDDDYMCEYLTLKCYQYYRKVYIEDAAILQPKYPDWPAYKSHKLFLYPSWRIYIIEESSRVHERAAAYHAGTTDGKLAELKELISNGNTKTTKTPKKRKVS